MYVLPSVFRYLAIGFLLIRERMCVGKLFQSSTTKTDESRCDRRFFFEEYDGGLEVSRDVDTMLGLRENGNERTSLCKQSSKEALGSGSESLVCILPWPGEFGTIKDVLRRATYTLYVKKKIYFIDVIRDTLREERHVCATGCQNNNNPEFDENI